jgi:Coenzyme PQQ synthesis protein D (PqqD)
MTSNPKTTDVLESRAHVPGHVVYREFVNETVVLNLQTGQYHGLNPSGGRMLDAITKVASVREAAQILAEEYQRPVDEIEGDLVAFCADLVDRGLIELSRNAGGA